MPLNYGKPTDALGKKLRDILNDDFVNVYISN